MIYFGLTFVFYEDYNVCPDFFFNVDIHMFQPHILKRLSLLHSTVFTLLSRSVDYIYMLRIGIVSLLNMLELISEAIFYI